MRESRTFAERTKALKSDQAKRKFFLIYEGTSTEVLYFNTLKDMRDEVGIDPLIELVPVMRSYSEEGWSNPKKILDRVIANLEEEKTGCITYESLLNRIMGYFYDEKILTTSKMQAHAIWEMLKEACERNLHKTLTEYVENLSHDCDELVQYLNQKSDIINIVDDISDIIKSSSITYEEGFDKICLIVDRDKESFLALPENNQYEYVLKTCGEKGFGFYVTNPCFEFWLLLHFDEVFDLDRNKLLENPKVNAKRRYTEQRLRKLLPGYCKGKYNAKKLIKRIEKAVENEKKFCEDAEKLVDTLGSKVGILIRQLCENHECEA